ncbi:hypothetical protein [Anaerocolumna chitinilytica]|uniref:Uncharacterized protein n=1 Tax=Anaerocolumna chitinilytica TaxID=1727145 RepID=A0A7I8DIT7_9FIRM|nr:hypothetical protein [Anaerocolumna chitinilytica]BCJ98349.1 hypothetical protein bsdcttw_13900 [Anaerocolumna chitinilytica]
MNIELFCILVFIFLSQFMTNYIVIYISRKKSLNFIGPQINQSIPNIIKDNINYDNSILFFFDTKCTTCREVIKEITYRGLEQENIKYVTYGSDDIIKEIKEKYNICNLYVLPEKTIKETLKITLFPLVLKLKGDIVKNKGIASYGYIRELIENEN